MKCSTAFCNRPAPMPSFEVPAPFCKWCSENPGSGRIRVVEHRPGWELGGAIVHPTWKIGPLWDGPDAG